MYYFNYYSPHAYIYCDTCFFHVVIAAVVLAAAIRGRETDGIGGRHGGSPLVTQLRGVGIGRGNPADRIPPLNGSAGITWRPATRWTLDGWLNFADQQDRYSPRDEVDPRIRPDSTPGWATLNVRAAWKASEHVYTSLQYGNIGDHRYREFGSGLDAAGRGIVLTLELRL